MEEVHSIKGQEFTVGSTFTDLVYIGEGAYGFVVYEFF